MMMVEYDRMIYVNDSTLSAITSRVSQWKTCMNPNCLIGITCE